MITVECKDTVRTPDAGYTSTILVSATLNHLPFTDKSIAVLMEESGNCVRLTYRNGERVVIPHGNIRYISWPAEIKNKKETPHLNSPNKK
jgi:hypothetical protein